MHRMGLPLCIWMGGIRRAEEGTPQCGVPPPRGARARASASAERKQAAARAENPFLAAPEGIAILMQGVSKLRCFSFA